jgi:hypothetical protein
MKNSDMVSAAARRSRETLMKLGILNLGNCDRCDVPYVKRLASCCVLYLCDGL